MSLSYSDISQLYKTHPALRLLRAEHAPLILSFLDSVFVQPNIRLMSQSNLESKLDDTLYTLRSFDGEEAYPRSARSYLDEWAQNDKGWLRKFYLADSDEPYFDLMPATEKALAWIGGLQGPSFIGTESRLLTIFDLLRQMVTGSETDVETRISELEKRKSELDDEISAIRRGEISVMDETALRDRFIQFSAMAKELLGDFRSVEHNFRILDSQVRENIAAWSGSKGELLAKIFGDRDVITDSDQGRSFKAFWDFLMSSRSQDEFTELLGKVFSMDAVSGLTDDKRLRHIHFDWLEAGEYTQRTVASLSQQLRRYLDNQAYLENKRIINILDSITRSALSAKEQIPKGSFMNMDESSPSIVLPMERPLFSPKPEITIDSLIQTGDGGDIDYQALFNQVYVDKAKLASNIRKELHLQKQISLKDVIEKHPLQKGLAELITYISIASEDHLTIFDDAHAETIEWIDENERHKHALIPKIILTRV